MRRTHHTHAQAIVEFALAATLIFLLLAAAVDLGLLFFTKQSLTNAAQEGATYGSRWLVNGSTGVRQLDIPGIQERVRFESGETGNGISNLTDLNSDNINDANQSGVIDPSGRTGYIQVRAIADTNMDGNPVNDGPADCPNPASSPVTCYALVTVTKTYNTFFPLSPAIGEKLDVTSRYYLLIRDSYRSAYGSNPPNFATPTPTPDVNQIKITSNIPSTFPASRSNTRWSVVAYNEAVNSTNGAGIQQVAMEVVWPDGSVHNGTTDAGVPYCVFGGSGSCNQMPTSSDWNIITGNPGVRGTFIVRVTATALNGLSRTQEFTVTR